MLRDPQIKSSFAVIGPDGKPLIVFNSGRGRGRPNKNIDRCIHVEPTSSFFFRTIDKVGFDEIYMEIFIKKKSKVDAEVDKDEMNESTKDDQDQDE